LATWAPRSPCFRIGEKGSAVNDLTFDGPLLAAETLHIKLTGPHYFSLSIPRRTEHACTPLGFRPTRFIFSHAGTPPLSYPLSLGLARSPASPLRHARTPWHAAAEAGAGRLGSDALGGDTGHHPRRVGTAHRLLHRRPQPRPVQRCKAAPPKSCVSCLGRPLRRHLASPLPFRPCRLPAVRARRRLVRCRLLETLTLYTSSACRLYFLSLTSRLVRSCGRGDEKEDEVEVMEGEVDLGGPLWRGSGVGGGTDQLPAPPVHAGRRLACAPGSFGPLETFRAVQFR
jgi:hypothetical protein